MATPFQEVQAVIKKAKRESETILVEVIGEHVRVTVSIATPTGNARRSFLLKEAEAKWLAQALASVVIDEG